MTDQPAYSYSHASQETFGIHVYTLDVDSTYETSHTGTIFTSNKTEHKPMVLSFVNGTMCVNPLGSWVDATNFDGAALEILLAGEYRPTGLACFDKETGHYTTEEIPHP